jgi:acetylornithine/succinyldiaminopimelate/putrescine aminotransferase
LASGPLLTLYPNRGLTFARGDGAYLFTRDGTRYLDLMTNYGASLLGHNHPVITAALSQQVAALTTLHGSFGSDVRARASMALIERLPMLDASLCWLNSGAEAVEAALKFAAAATGRSGFVACTGGYHGKTLGALAVTHAGKYRALFQNLLLPVRHVEFGSATAADAAIDHDTAAVIVEPIQGESGVVMPPDGYLRELREVCAARNVVLIVDEIQTGCGRTGTFTVSEREGVEPDILCLGKGLAGGIPIGVTAVRPAIAERLGKGIHTSTFGGNPLAAAGVIATLSIITPELMSRVQRLGGEFMASLAAAHAGSVTDVRGRGLMIGVAVRSGRDQLLKNLQEQRVLAIPAGDDVVRFLPALIVEHEQLMEAAQSLVRAVTE